MTYPTFGLLAKLRPPPGFRTEAALGATYSADLLTCMAVLTTMDGGNGEQVSYGRVEAYRALDRLSDKVRICYHAGRISRRDGVKYPSLALLDRVLVPVRPRGRGSFHPKVWLVRQVDEASRERFVLVVSSRNITASLDWDLGIALEGSLSGAGIVLPRVRAFAEHALSLAGEPGRLKSLGKLEDVRWTLPPHIRELSFDFQVGSDGPRKLHQEWSRFAGKSSRVLLLSPFIDEGMVEEAARRWGHVPTRRLVAGTDDLISVALGPKREVLRALDPRQMTPASEASEPPEAEVGEARENEIEKFRALHAKVIAIDDGLRATVIVGSNNLTSSGWRGGSTEAFVRLVGDADLTDSLWDWAGAQAELFDFPKRGSALPKRPILEQQRDDLHAVLFRLEDVDPKVPSRLVMLDPPQLQLREGVQMEVARYTTPHDRVAFPSGTSTIYIPNCAPALRTRFIVCTLRHEDDEIAWIAAADLVPPLGDERDRELVAQLLGLRQFLAYLQALHTDGITAGATEGEPDDDVMEAVSQHLQTAYVDSVNLEGLLRQLASNPGSFDEMDAAVTRYGEVIKKGHLSFSDAELLEQFLKAWAAIREAFSR